MEVVIVFMKLPPRLPWWRKRKFPTSFFPSREEYRALVKESATAGKIDYSDLLQWEHRRQAELLSDK